MSVDNVELAKLVEEYRWFLPEGFLAERDAVAVDLAAGRSIDRMQARGEGATRNRDISRRVLAELGLLLCTEDPRYEKLRQAVGRVEITVASTIGRVVSKALDLDEEAAIGCVLLLWQVCRRVGVNNFCRLCPPPHDTDDTPGGSQPGFTAPS